MKRAGDIYFNELSLQPFGEQEETKDRILTYSKVLKHCGGLGHKKVRYEYEFDALMISENQSLKDYCFKNLHRPELHTAINLMLSTQYHPYIDDETPQEKDFIEHQYQLIIENYPRFGYGLTTAFLNDSFAIGFCSGDTWSDTCFTLIVDADDRHPKEVFCVSLVEHFEELSFVNWYVSTYTIPYPARKQVGDCHLRPDHGKDILMEFAHRILKEDFVVEVVNSLPFVPQANSFIEKVLDNGLIYIRLTNTDRGLGLVVRTVGNDMLRTTYFAKILQEKYGR